MGNEFIRITLRTTSSLLIWAAHFLLVYGYTGLVCARRGAPLPWLSPALVPWAIGLATILAAGATTAIIFASLRIIARARAPADTNPGLEHWLTAAFGILALVAILWQAMPAALMMACP